MKYLVTLVSFLALCLCSCERSVPSGTSTDGDTPPTQTTPDNILQGGDNTIFETTSQAYAFPAPTLAGARLGLHLTGDAAFEASFVAAPADINPGLGPYFNNVSCEGCHPSDGRGRPPIDGEQFHSMFLRISLGDGTATGQAPVPVPGFGTQLFDKTLFSQVPLGRMDITYEEIAGSYSDGADYTLLRPTYTIADPYTSLPEQVAMSPRVAPAVYGRGMLEIIPESAILALADPDDADGDGISGKANYVWDFAAQDFALGRFGWKGDNPHLLQQTAGAYRGDMGITNPYFPDESVGPELGDGLNDDPELDQATLDAVTFYVQTLAVPARRNWEDPEVQRGEVLFSDIGCADCHTPRMETGPSTELPELAEQVIYPYTDMLLHDMGAGLADNRAVFAANGREWKTPALWGIGLTQRVNGHSRFLHDGRARNLTEAVLWHGGEADASRIAFSDLSAADRDALIAFLTSL